MVAESVELDAQCAFFVFFFWFFVGVSPVAPWGGGSPDPALHVGWLARERDACGNV